VAGGSDFSLSLTRVFAERLEVVEGIFNPVAVASLEGGPFLAAGGQFLLPTDQQGLILGESVGEGGA
jgi:hypothetical protein